MTITFHDIGQATSESYTIPAGTTTMFVYAQGAGGSGDSSNGGGGGRGNGALFCVTGTLGGKVLTAVTGTGGAAPSSLSGSGNNGTHTTITWDNGWQWIAGGAECASGGRGGVGGNTAVSGSTPSYVTQFGQFNITSENGMPCYGSTGGRGGGNGDSGGGGNGGNVHTIGVAGVGGYIHLQCWPDFVSFPSQAGNSGKFLTTDGTNISWGSLPAGVASQTGNSGKLLSTDGTNTNWTDAPTGTIPSQTGNSGKFLTTDGTTASWGTPSGGGSWTIVPKNSDTTRTSTSTLSSDPDLKITMSASTKYRVRGVILFSSTTTPGFKWTWTGPSSPTSVLISTYFNSPSAFGSAEFDTAYSSSHTNSFGGAETHVMYVTAEISNGANSGDLTFQWAQQTSNAGSTKVLAGSYIEYA